MLWISRLLEERRERRRTVMREAASLLLFLGDMAYDEARNRARSSRRREDHAGAGQWSAVAVEIARRTGRRTGLTTADRYEEARRGPEPRRAVVERRVADYTVEIGRSLARLTQGEQGTTELHNVGAAVRNAASLVRASGEVEAAADALLAAAAGLASQPHESREWLAQGIYPPALETAAAALEHFRAAVLKAG